MFKERIEEREKTRAQISESDTGSEALWLISETLDDYLAQRIEADKVLEGILKDIQGNIASMAELNRSVLTEAAN